MTKQIQYIFHIFLIIIGINQCNSMESESQSIINYSQLIKTAQSIGGECVTITDTVTAIPPLYYQMADSISLQYQIQLEMAALNLKKVFDEFMIKNLQEYLKNINELRAALNIEKRSIKPNYSLVTSAIRRKDFSVARYQFKAINNTIYLKDIIEECYGKNLTNAENLIDFLNSLVDTNTTIFGYQQLFQQIKQNQHENEKITITIALKMIHFFNNFLNKDEQFINLQKNLPNSFKEFPWNSVVSIKNVKFSTECIIARNIMFDHNKRNIFTDNDCTKRSHLKLIPNKNWNSFHIKNHLYQEYLIADEIELTNDKKRRRIFSIEELNKKDKTGQWKFESIEGTEYFKIKNIKWNEYLYIAEKYDYITAFESLRYLVTWKFGACDDDSCKWKIEKSSDDDSDQFY